MNFAQISFTIQDKTGSASFDWLHIPFTSRGFIVQTTNTIAIIDETLHLVKQIVLPGMQLGNDVVMHQNSDFYDLIYNLDGNSTAQITFSVGLSQFNPDLELTQLNYLNSLIENNTQNYQNKISDLPLTCFDYRAAIQQWNISYIALRDLTQLPRFADAPLFTLDFKNDEVAIFKVNQG